MSSSARSGPTKERGGSLLPSHAERTPQDVVKPEDRSSLNEDLEVRYNAAATQLHELEEELDVLIHSAHSLREQRTKTALGCLKHLDDRTTMVDNEGQLVDDYLALVAKGKAIDDVIKTVKEECTAIRFKCSVILSQIRDPSDTLRQALRDKECSANEHTKNSPVSREATEDATVMENKLADFAGVAGAFGGGITFSTTFCASRGRLDIISWAFACFLWVMIDWAVLKLLATLPRRRDLNGRIAALIRSEHPGYGGSLVATMIEQRSRFIFVLALGVAVPLVAGFTLLGVAVATLNGEAHIPDPGSRVAIKASGYYIIALLGNLLLSSIWAVAAYPALRRLYQINRLLPGLKDLHISLAYLALNGR